jgi:hypothetical protein
MDDKEHPVLRYLSRLDDAAKNRDVFTPSAGMLEFLNATPASEKGPRSREAEEMRRQREEELKRKKEAKKSFQQGHRLQATSITQGAEMAIVDGKVLRIGDTLDGFKLTEITPYTAQFELDEDVFELRLPTQP